MSLASFHRHPLLSYSPGKLQILGLALAAAISLPLIGDDNGSNILPAGSFDDIAPTYNPWAGVDDQGNIHGLEGNQIQVSDDGTLGNAPFSPSVAVGDLNGDGKPDLVLADTKGLFWYFPNIGTPDKPAFGQGEVIPIWLGERRVVWNTEGVDNYIPRIQLVESENNKLLDIVAGTYAGKLFRIPNIGSVSQPVFKPTYDTNSFLINTRKQGALWCNYLAPCFTKAFNPPNSLQGAWDMVMGEGTYSANNIYLLRNQEASQSLAFDEDHTSKIIRGMGLEQLTPYVVDWNNDGKPDILCGDRTGFLNLYLNNSTDPANPTFAPPVHVTVGGVENFGSSITICVADLTGNHLPNLLIGQTDGTILYAVNKGKLGTPSFDTPPTPLKGVLPPDYHYTSLSFWKKEQAYGTAYELVGAVNPTLEKGFTFPDGVTSHYALKFSVCPVNSKYFKNNYYTQNEDECNEHVVNCNQGFTIKLNQKYHVHFWVKTDGNISNLRYRFYQATWPPPDPDKFQGYWVTKSVSANATWSEETSDVEVENQNDPTTTTFPYFFEFRFNGQGTLYVDDLRIHEAGRLLIGERR